MPHKDYFWEFNEIILKKLVLTYNKHSIIFSYFYCCHCCGGGSYLGGSWGLELKCWIIAAMWRGGNVVDCRNIPGLFSSRSWHVLIAYHAQSICYSLSHWTLTVTKDKDITTTTTTTTIIITTILILRGRKQTQVWMIAEPASALSPIFISAAYFKPSIYSNVETAWSYYYSHLMLAFLPPCPFWVHCHHWQ